MQRDNATHLPVPQCAFDPTVRAVAKFLATAEGQLIGCKASECTLDVKIAGAPFCSLVVQALPLDTRVRAVAKFLATAEGHLIGCKASECTLDVKIAGAPFCSLVVQVLP